jgi:hypothetical protein
MPFSRLMLTRSGKEFLDFERVARFVFAAPNVEYIMSTRYCRGWE